MKQLPNTSDFARFTEAMRDILKVSKSEMEEHKESGKRLSKGASLDPAVSYAIRFSLKKP